jgi:polyphosphate kinase
MAVHNTFNYLTAYAEQPNYKPLMLAPVGTAKSCIALIDREARNVRRGKPARNIVKVNAVVDLARCNSIPPCCVPFVPRSNTQQR